MTLWPSVTYVARARSRVCHVHCTAFSLSCMSYCICKQLLIIETLYWKRLEHWKSAVLERCRLEIARYCISSAHLLLTLILCSRYMTTTQNLSNRQRYNENVKRKLAAIKMSVSLNLSRVTWYMCSSLEGYSVCYVGEIWDNIRICVDEGPTVKVLGRHGTLAHRNI